MNGNMVEGRIGNNFSLKKATCEYWKRFRYHQTQPMLRILIQTYWCGALGVIKPKKPYQVAIMEKFLAMLST